MFRTVCLWGSLCLWLAVAATLAPGADPPPQAPPAVGEIAGLIRDLAGPDAGAEFRATERLAGLGEAAVPALAQLAGDSKEALPGRLIAIELLGRIGTPAARDGLLAVLRQERTDLAVRGQACMQLGQLRERQAIPIIADWLGTIGPRTLNDIPRQPKESQPATCYIRHVEALGQIGDEGAIAILAAFRKKIPGGVGYGGFLTNFVTGAVDETIADLRVEAAFRARGRRVAGLEAQADLLFAPTSGPTRWPATASTKTRWSAARSWGGRS